MYYFIYYIIASLICSFILLYDYLDFCRKGNYKPNYGIIWLIFICGVPMLFCFTTFYIYEWIHKFRVTKNGK